MAKNYVDSISYGPFSYKIEKEGKKKYRLWMNGCRIGRPRPDKPADQIWEYSANSIREARNTIKIDVEERLNARIKTYQAEADILLGVLQTLSR